MPADIQLVQHIKTTVQYLPKLYNPEIKDFLIVETDASDDTWAGCLKAIQNGNELLGLDIDGNQIPQSQPSELALLSNEQNYVLKTEKYDAKLCKYISGTFSQAEKNYSTHEKEILACLRTLKKWKIDLSETRIQVMEKKNGTSSSMDHLESQTAKLNTINRMKNIPTTNKRVEMRKPSVENFQRLWDSLISYNDVHTSMMFYPKRREIGPKVVFFPQASPKDVYDYFIHGLVDSLYFHGNNPKELLEFPPKVQNAIKVYNDLFAKGRELYLKMHSSFSIFNRERKLVVPSVTIAQLGVSNQDYPSKDVNIEPTTPTLDDLALSLFRVYRGSSKIGSGPG
uniref:Reverse transcriptase n=1 Tax=Tanacetum cinerariifolium TaxID=118510 RepID=A0A6L2L1D0_TANCI|nr:reverse transcriptase [Tanacetum cinerariifolium]